jgi:fused signal recognition particle receptor
MMERWQALSGALGPNGLVAVVVGVVVLLVVVLALVVRRGRRTRARASALRPGTPRGAEAGGLRQGLAKTRAGLFGRLLPFLGRAQLDPSEVESIETALLGADVGVRTTTRLLEAMQRRNEGPDASIHERLEREIRDILEAPQASPAVGEPSAPASPHVIMVVGVNGVGKTTSIGKLAARHAALGRRVLLVAADTFRAAASEQLAVWAERTGADLVRHQQGADPGAVAYDGLRAAVARHADVVIVDTAGRLHTKSNLMDELRKVRRVIGREVPGAPHETLLVVDAVTGQNGLAQARAFLEQLEVTGVILTKLDGTARGGIVLAIAGELQLPIRFVGVGEGVDDLREFDPEEFARALLAPSEAGGTPVTGQ